MKRKIWIENADDRNFFLHFAEPHLVEHEQGTIWQSRLGTGEWLEREIALPIKRALGCHFPRNRNVVELEVAVLSEWEEA